MRLTTRGVLVLCLIGFVIGLTAIDLLPWNRATLPTPTPEPVPTVYVYFGDTQQYLDDHADE